jgi:dUTP pyrophosphatase
MKLPVKRLDPAAVLPEYKTPGAAAFDLATIESKTLAPREIHRFRTGLVFCIPADHLMLIASRSSNSVKKGISLANGTSIIDSDYGGETDEIVIPIQNITDSPVTIAAGERIAQAIIIPIVRVELTEVETTGQNNRGGFGSTGR